MFAAIGASDRQGIEGTNTNVTRIPIVKFVGFNAAFAKSDGELMQLIKKHNSHDVSLYWRVWHLHQERMAVYRKLEVNQACAKKLEDLKLRAGLVASPEFEAEVANLDEIEDLI